MMSWTMAGPSYPDGEPALTWVLPDGEPVAGALKGIGFRFGCQFQASPVFPYKPRPFLIDTPV